MHPRTGSALTLNESLSRVLAKGSELLSRVTLGGFVGLLAASLRVPKSICGSLLGLIETSEGFLRPQKTPNRAAQYKGAVHAALFSEASWKLLLPSWGPLGRSWEAWLSSAYLSLPELTSACLSLP